MRKHLPQPQGQASDPRSQLDLFAPRADRLPIEPITVKISTAVRITGIGRSKLYELIKAGEIEKVKIGASTLLSVESLRRLLKVRANADEKSS